MINRISIILLFIILSIPIFSLDEKPLWVEFQEAKKLYENGEFQGALDFFLKVTKGDMPFPEAEYMIGLLYLEEGELDIAETQILKAIDLSVYLEVKEDLNAYKYSLAEVYLLKEEFDKYVYTLKEIIGGDEIDLDDIRDQKAYYDTLLESGLNRLMHLYRKKADNVLNARIYLGFYYNSIGHYKASVSYLLSPMLAMLSEAIDDNIKRDREYVFLSIESFFSEILENKRIRDYFFENDIYEVFYYLAESLYGLKHEERAMEIWKLLANSSIKSQWVNKSRKQVLNPTLETWKFIY